MAIFEDPGGLSSPFQAFFEGLTELQEKVAPGSPTPEEVEALMLAFGFIDETNPVVPEYAR